jgi:hypothetical protein
VRRGVGALLLGLITASLLVACADIEVDITVDDGGSGTLRTAVSFERALIEGLSDAPVSPASLLQDAGLDASAFPTDVTYEPIETDESVGIVLEVPFAAGKDTPAQIDRAFASLGEDVGALVGPGGLFEAFNLTQSTDGWQFEAATASSDAPDGLSALLTQDASFTFRLRLPGDLTSTNADRARGDGALEWDIPFDGSSRSLTARAMVGDDPGFPARAALASGALVIAVALAAWLRLRPRRPSER